jgi:hypothetical protein
MIQSGTDSYKIYRYVFNMSKLRTPEEFLDSQVNEFNKRNVNFLITLYENDACFASKPGSSC